MGRWQVLRKGPLMICDTGHNKEGIKYVTGQIERMKVKKVHFVIGFVSDKDLSLVLPLFPQNAQYYFTRASVPRALDEKILQAEASSFNLKGECYPSVKIACEAALKNASAHDMIFVGGSTFVVADVL
jgi:dihydrofolate synthase/folylpolyglutamate synthase